MDRLLRLSQIIPYVIPVSKTSWWNGVKSGLYPPSIKLGPRTTVWRESDIMQVIAGTYAKPENGRVKETTGSAVEV